MSKTTPLVLVIAGLLLSGCAAAKLTKQGDACMLASQPQQALGHYKEALAKDPDLARKPAFVEKLKLAESQAAYAQGKALAEQGQWDQAVQRFSDSIEIDPTFEKAGQALAHAKREASRMHYRQALDLADQGKLSQAILELKRALDLDPENRDAKEALESTQQRKKDQAVRSQQLYETSLALQAQKRWLKSAGILQSAVELNPNHVMYRVSLHRARDALEQARDKHAAGSKLLGERRLDKAIQSLEAALAIWPFFTEAEQTLAQARARRAEAESYHLKATALAKAGQWDDAVREASTAVEIYPFHPQAGVLLSQARHKAAAAHCQAAKELLAENDPRGAEKEFLLSLKYVPDFVPAHEGVAQAYGILGAAAQKQELWGSALLWYMNSASHVSDAEYAKKVNTARLKVLSRVSFGMSAKVSDANGGVTPRSSAFDAAVLAEISSRKPTFLSMASGQAAARPAAYAVAISLEGLDTGGGLVRSEKRTHRYTEYRDVPNPEIPRLRHLLASERNDLARLRRDFHQPCHNCGGKGRLVCQACRGSGRERCGTCHGTGRHTCRQCNGTKKVGDQTCDRCNGAGNVNCSSCRGSGQKHCARCSSSKEIRGRVKCRRCDGSGRSTRVSTWDISRQADKVHDLERKLRYTPTFVTKGFPAQWPYVVEYHEKTGSIETSITIADAASGDAIDTFAIRKTFAQRDSTVNNANPAIGLRADPLRLTSDGEVRSRLIQAAAGEVAAKTVALVLKARISETRARAQGASRDGKTAEALEIQVDAAHLTEALDPKLAEKLLAKLRCEQTTPATEPQAPAALSSSGTP